MLVENSLFTHQEMRIGVTISIGATISRPEDTIESLVQRADQLMYRSKSNGRNLVSFES